MQLVLSRDEFTPRSTIGSLYADGAFVCYTLEDCDRFLEAGGVKVQNETAIPRGKYNVIVNFSNRFQTMMPLVMDVPGFTGVRIHSGNTDKDTDGCILVGMDKAVDMLTHSREAASVVYTLINKAIANGESVTIEVK
jgi:hypothetical protein